VTSVAYANVKAGGYTSEGWLSFGAIYIDNLNNIAVQGINIVELITANAWMVNVPQDNCGSFGLGPESGWIASLGNTTNSGYLVEIGPVEDQSFVGGAFTGFDTSFYAGIGDYSTLIGDTSSQVVLQNVT
jgi:hypothetical protein